MRQQAVTEWHENNDENYLKIIEIVKQVVENALEDRRIFLRTSLRSLIRSLPKEPSRFYAYYFNTPLRVSSPGRGQCVQDNKTRQDYEDQVIDEADRLYSQTVENLTNEVITNLSDNKSSVLSSSIQKELSEQNRDNVQMSASNLHFKEEHTLFHPEDKGLEGNSSEEPSEVQHGYRMVPFPYKGQAVHPNFDAFEND
jgi:hypothetical protein